jgi:hypothetical protein
MTIIVRKPFEPFEDKNQANAVAKQVHPEFEEKPVVESTTQTSENSHGGSELTFSIDSSQSSGREQQQQNSTVSNQADQDTQGNTSTSNNADTNTANNNNGQSAQEQQNSGKSNDGNTLGSNAGTNGQGTQEPQSTTNDVDTQPQDGNDESGSSVNNQADSASQEENDGDEVGDTQGQENEQNSENGNEESNESEDTDNEQSQSGTYNTQQVVDVTSGNINAKYYQTEFYRFIELIAEERTRAYDPMGSDEYNVKKLMLRQFERKPLSSYKMSRVRESVVIILDNSGSMQWWTDNLQILAELAMQRSDVEVYLAPNGYIEERLYPKRQLVNHDDVVRGLRNRKIIYVGDFDGADTPIELSWYNDVIWICPESRYVHFQEHDWVHYDEGQFRGAFLRIFTLGEMFNAFRRLLSNPSLKLWYDLCNGPHKCGYDEGDGDA